MNSKVIARRLSKKDKALRFKAGKAGKLSKDSKALKFEADQAWTQLAQIVSSDKATAKVEQVLAAKQQMQKHPECHKYKVNLEARNRIGIGDVYDVWDLRNTSTFF